MLYSIVGILVIIFDQIVKFWVDKTINWTNPVRAIIPGVLSLVRVQNDGAAFSFLSGGGARIWFIVLTAVFALLVVLALATNFISGRFGRWCLVFITAGGLSNMIDRVLYGYVLDMFKVELFNFAVFNVADIFISVFCVAFIIYILFGGEKEKEPDADEFDEDDYEDEAPVRPVKKAKAPKEKSHDTFCEDEEAPVVSRRRTPAPAEKPAKAARAKPARAAAPAEDEDDAFSSYYASTSQAKTKAKSVSQDEMFAEMFGVKEQPASAERRATAQQRPAPAQRKAAPAPAQAKRSQAPAEPVFDPNDPFAEWERANARSSASAGYNVAPEAKKPRPINAELESAAQAVAAQPVRRQPKPAPAKVETPAPAKSAPAFDDDFDLDSILSEFK